MVHLGRQALRTWLVALFATVGLALGLSVSFAAVTANPTPVCANNVCTVTFAAGNEYSFTQPAGVPLTVTLKGGKGGKGGNDAQGGAVGLAGDVVTFSITTDGNPIAVYPGSAGGDGVGGAGNGGGAAGVSAYPNGGYDGGLGGHAGPACCSGGGGGGGAASVIVIKSVEYVAAGGSGGAGGDQFCVGPPANPYALANSTATTNGKNGINASGDGSGSGGGGGGQRGGNGGAMGSCSSETLGYGGYSGLSFAPAGATTTVAGNNATGVITISYPDKVATTVVPSATFVKTNSLTYTVTFAEAMTGLATTDFTISGTATGCKVTAVSAGTTTYTVTVSGCSPPAGSKTLILTLPIDSASSSTARGNAAVTAATVTLDDASPTVTLSGPTPVSQTAAFDFILTGSEALDGVAAGDFTLTGAGCSIESVTGTGATRNIHVIGCTNGTTAKLSLTAGSITDLAGNIAPAITQSFSVLLDIPAAPAVLTPIVLSGETSTGAQEGTTLTLSGATFSPADHGNVVYNSYSYVWYRCYSTSPTASATLASDCLVIPGASVATYTTTTNDVGYSIRGSLVATNASGTITTASASSSVVRETDPLATGDTTTCVVREGLVYCWGLNDYGQTGNGVTGGNVTSPSIKPVQLATGGNLTGVVSVDASLDHTCALTYQGAMYCWGINNYGQINDGTTATRNLATLATGQASGGISFASGVVAISVGDTLDCAVKAGGLAYCWGFNNYGQLGDGTATARNTPAPVLTAAATPLTGVTDISVDNLFGCALTNSTTAAGQVYCWGYNGHGQLADGTLTSRYYAKPAMVGSTPDAPFVGVTDLSVGMYNACAVQAGASLCWGYNVAGNLGTGNTTNASNPVVSIATGVIDVEVGENNQVTSCFLKFSGALYCAGQGTSGQLTDGTIIGKKVPTASTIFTTGTSVVSVGDLFTCAIDASGLTCVGSDANGQLGDGQATTTVNKTGYDLAAFTTYLGTLDMKPVAAPTTLSGYSGTGQVLTGATVVEPATLAWAGYPKPAMTYQWYSCTTTGAASDTPPANCTVISGATSISYTPVTGDVGKFLRFAATGTNSVGTTTNWSATTAAVGISPTNNVLPTIALKAGSAGIIPGNSATATAGTWTGSPTPTTSFVWYRCSAAAVSSTLTAPSGCVQITEATGANYKFTPSDVGSYIRAVEIGLSASGINYAYTATVGPVLESRTITAGLNFTCAVKDGYVYCWGYNASGQLGDGTLVDKNTIPATPLKLADGTYLKNVVSIDAGNSQACALTTSGAMYCWGYNGYGQLGDGSTTNHSVPALVNGLSSGVIGITVGYNVSCAIKTGGALYCWGYNANGSVGDGTAVSKSVPTAVTNMAAGVTQVQTDNQTTCAIKNGAAFCWGYNGYGTIGDNTVTSRSTATAVAGLTTNVTDITVGYSHACAVKDGAAFCWGYNANGQLGDGTVTQRNVPVAVLDTTATTPIKLSTGVVDVEAAEYDPGFTCFTRQTGHVYCTGNNAQGQLGTGNATQATVAVAPALYPGIVTGVALGRYHSCMIMDAKISCIGYNVNGEIANGTATSSSTVLSTQTAFGNPTGALDFAPVSGGASITGYSGTGQLLTGATVLDPITGTWYGYSYPTLSYQWLRCGSTGSATSTVPGDCVVISGATALTYTPVAADLGKFLRFEVIGTNSAGTTLAVSATTAAVGAAPANTNGPGITLNAGSAGAILGDSATVTPGTWTGTPTPGITYQWYRCSSDTLTVAPNCVLITDATGINYNFTQSDIGSYIRGLEVAESSAGINTAFTPAVGPVRESRVIAAGMNHTCAIKLGFVYCWGLNANGQLGDGTTVAKTSIPTTPVKLADGTFLKNVVSVDASDRQTCALTTGGAMYCWGYNGYGQIGDGTTVDKLVPTLVTGLSSGVVGMVAGSSVSCAIKVGGALYCWGYNANGQLGDNTATQRTTPVQVITATATPITNVIQVVSNYQTTCAIKLGGALFCWGYNGNGMIGDGTTSARWMPTAVVGMGAKVTDVSAGYYNNCAVKDGAAFCWGYNAAGQLGDGTATQRTSPVAVIDTAATTPIKLSSGVVDVESGEYDAGYTCFTKQTGKVYCTGGNAQGQLGTGNATAATTPTAATLFTGNVTAIALGRYHTCAVMDLKISCIGFNTNGELGNGTTTASRTVLATATAFGNPTGALDVLPVSGGATETGYTGVGEVLTGATTIDPLTGTWAGYSYPTLSYQWLRCTSTGAAQATVPADCKPIAGATSITYTETSLDVGKYLRFEVIGTNSVGSVTAVSATSTAVGLAPGNTALPNLVDADGGYAGSIPGVTETINSGSWSGTPAPAISYSWYRCLTSKSAASLTDPTAGDCWAIDSATAKTYTLTASDVGYYIVGVETALSTSGKDIAYTQSTTQVRQSNGISAGDNHVCAVRLGRVYCWGLGTSGQLGDGTIVSKSVATGPVKFADGTILEDVVTVESQDTGTCAVTVSGSLYCWGTEGTGEFGDGTLSAVRTTPVRAMLNATTPLTDVVGISTSPSATCAIRTGGSLWCWGYNAVNGQLGDGTTTNRLYPVQIIASGVQQVSQDGETTCAIVSSALKCWGLNNYNQVGDGTTTSRTAPVAVTGMASGVTDISVGFYHTCAIKDGAAYCWGYNAYGQVGNGVATTTTTPAQVSNTATGVNFTDDVVNIDANEMNAEHTCATKTGGVLYCWGYNAYGQLTNGLAANALVPVASTLWTSGVSEVTAGYRFTCVIQNGADYCTGYNVNGEVGNGTVTSINTSNQVAPLTNFAGSLDVAPIAGTVSVTGTPAVGQTLTGATTPWVGFPMPTVTYQWYNCVKSGSAAASVPADCTMISGATGLTYMPTASDVNNYVRLVATGTSTAGTTVAATSALLVGTLPDATFIERTTAPAGFIPVGTTITQYADQWEATPAATFANAWYRCATTGAATETVPSDCTLIAGATGTTYVTTQSDVASYIRGAQVATNSLGTTTALAPTAGYVTETKTIAVGADTSCVVKAGEVWCAGAASLGQLGNLTTTDSTVPVKVMIDATTPLNKVVSVSGNAVTFCALTETGALYCWGANTYGQLGNGATTNLARAVLVTSGTAYAAVDAANNYTCAIKVGGQLFCWGYNNAGQLGDGTLVNKSVPTAVTNMGSGVSQVSAGWQLTCAVKNGAAFCWGGNANYQLGDGTNVAKSVPTAVGPTQVAPIVTFDSGVTDIAASTVHVCLVKNGAAYCWGNSTYGQIAIGVSTGNAGYPVQVVATATGTVFTSGVVDVEVSVNNSSVDSTYFTKTDGSLYAAGSQVNGVLFNGVSTTFSNKAIAAAGFASGVSEVSAGYGDVCVVKAGALSCIGANAKGQLLNSPATPIVSPVTAAVSPAVFASGLGDVALAPAVVTPPTVDGTPGLANVSAGDPGSYSANPAATLTYKWYTCTQTGGVATSVPADCVASTGPGATTLNYTPVAADAAKYLRLAVTATNSAGSVTSVSAASTQVTGKGNQTIAFGPVASPAIGGTAVTLAATATSNLAVTYTSATPLVCTVTAGKVTALIGGRCEITATQAGDATFNAASATLELFVDKTANIITFTAADRAYSTTPVSLVATASSGLPVSFVASPATICTVSGSTLTTVNIGTCVITASQAGNDSVTAATPVTVNMVIGKASQTIALSMPTSLSVLDTVGVTLTPTASAGGVVTLDTANPSICAFVNGKLVGLSQGTCTVVASQAGDTKYNPVQANFNVSVTRAPNVASATTAVTSPTNSASVAVALTFDTAVTGLAVADLTTAPAACTVASVSGSGTSYSVTLNNCAEGNVSIKLAANTVSNGVDGPSVAYTSPVLFTVDKTAPTVAAATTTSPALSNSALIDYTVTFSESVTGIVAADFANSGTATGCVVAVTPVTDKIYTVSYSACADGTVGVKVLAKSLTDVAGNAGPAAIYSGTAPVTIDRSAATVASITTTAPSNTKTLPIPFVVTFSEGVTGFTAADVAVIGTAENCQVAVTAVSATAYGVSVTGCTDGTVGIKVLAGSVADIATNASPASDVTSQLVTLDTAAPSAPEVTTSAPEITNSLPIAITVTFAEPVTGLEATDLAVLGTATGCQISLSAVSSTVYTATLTACTDGTIGLSVKANAVLDAAGNSGPVVLTPGTTLTTLDRVAPVVASTTTAAAAFVNTLPINFRVTFAEPVAELLDTDLKVSGTAGGCELTVTEFSAKVYDVEVDHCVTDGTIGLQVLSGAVTDLAGNAGPATNSTSPSVTLDRIAPDAPVLTNMPGEYTNGTEIDPVLEMDGRFTYTCEFDGAPISCGSGELHIGSVASPLDPGMHNLKAWVTDQAGNTSVAYDHTWIIGDYAVPATPDAPTVERPARNQIDVSWIEPEASAELPVVGYDLEYNIDGITWISAAHITDPTVTDFTLNTARSGLEYSWRVKALGAVPADSSDFSAESIYDAEYIPEITYLSLKQSVMKPPAGATVTLTGFDFAAGETDVTFGDNTAEIISVATDGLSAVVAIPESTVSGPVDITVTSGTGLFQGASTSAGAFTYLGAAGKQTLSHIVPVGLKAGTSTTLAASFDSGIAPVVTVAPASAAICKFEAGKLVALAVGACNYSISAPANAGFQAYPAKSFSAAIAKGDNVTTVNLPAGLAAGGTPIRVEPFVLANTSSAGLPVTNTSGPATICYVDSTGKLRLIGTGTCNLVSTSGNANFATSSVTTPIVVTKNNQTLTFVAPGEVVPNVLPEVKAPAATDSTTGFKLMTSTNSGLKLTYTSLDPKVCEVDQDGVVSWIGDLVKSPNDPAVNTCKVQVTQAGNTNYAPLTPTVLTLTATHVVSQAPAGGIVADPEVSGAIGRNGGKAVFGSDGFDVKISSKTVTITPYGEGVLIGPITATVKIPYKENVKGKLVAKVQTCSVKFGITKKMTVAHGALLGKKFTTTLTCTLNTAAFAWFKAGNALDIKATVIRDRRWPTTYLKIVGKESPRKGWPLYQTKKLYKLTIG